jgi:hypothetical protein
MKREKNQTNIIFLSFSPWSNFSSLIFFLSLFLYRSDIHCICMCVHHLWLKKDRWISRYLLLDFAHVIWWNLKQKKSGEEEEIRQLLFLLEYEQTGIDIDNGDDCCIRNETSFVLEVIIRLWDESRLITQ